MKSKYKKDFHFIAYNAIIIVFHYPQFRFVRKNTNEEFILAFGRNLRKIRKSKGLSMEQLAHLCNIEYSQISRIELGQINTTLNTIKILADALEIHPKELLDFEA